MRKVLYTTWLLMMSPLSHATAIDGWYSSLSGGYTYIPNNVDKLHNAIVYSDIAYKPGYTAGGSLGYYGHPLHYEGELTYFKANVNHFSQNYVNISNSTGYNQGVLGIANVLYEWRGLLSHVDPFVGIGVGYAWLDVQLDNLTTPAYDYHLSSTNFAYQGSAGVIYNFAENYALSLGYRYLATPHDANLNHSFQMNMATAGITYRFDGAKYR